jgi:hypothetical protein
MGKNENAYRICWMNLKEGDHLEDLRVDGRVILKFDLKEVRWGCVDWI